MIVGATPLSASYSSCVMPEDTPTIRSGSRAATASKLIAVDGSTVGVASPSSSVAHGHTADGYSPYHSRIPTGMTPSASKASWSVKPTDTTRCGSAGTTVSPYLCSMVTGNAADAAASGSLVDGEDLEVVDGAEAAGSTTVLSALAGGAASGSLSPQAAIMASSGTATTIILRCGTGGHPSAD